VARAVGAIEWRPDDVVLLAVKSNDTVAVLEELEVVADPSTAIVCLQNGVANEREALRRFANVYGVCVMCPASYLQPGLVAASSSPITGIFDIGRYPTGSDETAAAIAEAFETATFVSEARPDIMRWKYAKLLMNLGNAVEAAMGLEGRFTEVAAEARREAVACFRAAGIACATQQEDRDRRGDLLQMQPIEGEERGGGSSWQSLARGTGRIETDYLNGEIVLLGRLHGVATPVNERLMRVANDLARAGSPPGTLTEADLLA
ncbi:MAG TPA: ketopantoate reductase C-terminal domain-containing protein, partial [Acidimicrobiales bacterium]